MGTGVRSRVLLLVLLFGLGLLAASLALRSAQLVRRVEAETTELARASLGRSVGTLEAERLAAGRQQILREHAAAAAAGAVLLFLLWLTLDFGLTRPARRVAGVVAAFEAGEGSSRAGIAGRDEIGTIAAAFDALADRLDTETSDHRDSRRLLEAVLESLPVGIIVVRRQDGRPLFANPSWCEIYGRTPDAGRDILSILGAVRCERADGSVYPVEELAIPTVLRTGRPARVDGLRVCREDGSVVHVATRAMPIRLYGSEGFDAVLSVVEERREAETVRPAAAPHEPAPEAAGPPIPPRTETVLLVEDEAELLERASRALAGAGYRVLCAVDGDEALAVYRGGTGIIDAVVLDLTLPVKPGREVFQELLDLDPDARVILASGYHPDLGSILSQGRTAAILAKPYSVQRLTATVRSALERRRSGEDEDTPATSATPRASLQIRLSARG